MSWDAKDHRKGQKARRDTPQPAPTVPRHDDESLPTVAEAMAWDKTIEEAIEDRLWRAEEARALRELGFVDPQTWSAWAYMCRNGRREE